MGDNKIYKKITYILILVFLAGGWYLNRTMNDLNSIKGSYNSDKHYSTWRLRNDVVAMDNYLAKALVSIDDNSRFNALLTSLEYVNSINKSRENSLLMIRRYNPIFSQSRGYLYYLVRRNQSLSEIERENIKLVREHLAIIIPSYEKVNHLIEEKKLDVGFYNDIDIVKIMDKMVDELERLTNIGEDDIEYKNYRNNNEDYYPSDVFKGEKKYSIKELGEIVKEFMGQLWKDSSVDLTRAEKKPEYGECFGFVVTKGSTSYDVDISRLGGHIMRLWVKNDKDEVEMTKEETINYAKGLIERWGEEELILYDIREDSYRLYLYFVPVINKIPLVNRNVKITFDSGKFLGFYPGNYFNDYKRVPPLEAKLSKEEIINIIGNKFEIDGDPSLEVISGKSSSDVLVYKVPVKGVENIEYIYLNAITGGDEGIKYKEIIH